MEIPIYETQWHGIDLLQFSAAKKAQDKPAGPEFYAQFYAELAKRPVDPAFIAGKAAFGPVCLSYFLEPWEQRRRRKPKILSLGVGKGYIEEAWLKQGYEVTLQECQESSLRELLQKYPHARGAVGDASKIQFTEKFDVIAIFGLDFCLSRADLLTLFSHARSWLTPEGMVLFQSPSVLSVRQLLAETIKHVRRKFHRRSAVFWGWWRTLGELSRCGRSAGLRVAEVYHFSPKGGLLVRRHPLTRQLPNLRSPMIVMIFEPATA